MMKPTLVIMAAGLGSRYGGLKQIDPMGPCGEIIMDYSIYDAIRAGFGKVVFVIKKDLEELFREKIGNKIGKIIDTEYVFQKIDDIPKGFKVPEERIKPWGTAQAVLSCKDVVNTPFAVINADDFYGSTTFQLLNDYLSSAKDEGAFYQYCMVGFILENTLTEHGHVARGICKVDSNGYLKEIVERTKIIKDGKLTKFTEDDVNWQVIPEGSFVSMNTWGFLPSFFKELETGFIEFFEKNQDNLLKTEYFLPSVVDKLITNNKAQVKVLPSKERWYGVTYQQDKPVVKQAILDMIKKGIYPERLWGAYKF